MHTVHSEFYKIPCNRAWHMCYVHIKHIQSAAKHHGCIMKWRHKGALWNDATDWTCLYNMHREVLHVYRNAWRFAADCNDWKSIDQSKLGPHYTEYNKRKLFNLWTTFRLTVFLKQNQHNSSVIIESILQKRVGLQQLLRAGIIRKCNPWQFEHQQHTYH